jgi:hypothetical protein
VLSIELILDDCQKCSARLRDLTKAMFRLAKAPFYIFFPFRAFVQYYCVTLMTFSAAAKKACSLVISASVLSYRRYVSQCVDGRFMIR